MADIGLALTGAMRNTLQTLQSLQARIGTSQERLASGQRINAMVDAPATFFAARNLTNRANDMMSAKDAMGQAIGAVKTGSKGADTIQSLLAQARGLTTAALGSMGNDPGSMKARKNLAERFDDILDAIDGVADDSAYGGRNLIKGNGRRIEATTDSTLAALEIPGITNARVTNAKQPDDYRVDVTGTGAISGKAEDVSDAEQARGLQPIMISGLQSVDRGNFEDVTIALQGQPGRDKRITVGNPPEAVTRTFTREQWESAKASGSPLVFGHTFSNGTQVSFNVDFDLIESSQPNHGQGVSRIEKLVDFQIAVKDGAGNRIVRNAASPLGDQKLSKGENAFVFPSGTVRLDIDPSKLMENVPLPPMQTYWAENVSIDADDIKSSTLARSTYLHFDIGAADSGGPGYKTITDTQNGGWSITVPNDGAKDVVVTLPAGAGANAGRSFRFDVGSGTNDMDGIAVAVNYPVLRPQGSVPGITVHAVDPMGFRSMGRGTVSISAGAYDSAEPGFRTFSVSDGLGGFIDGKLGNTAWEIDFIMEGKGPNVGARINVTSISDFPGSSLWDVVQPGGLAVGATINTRQVRDATDADDIRLSFDERHRPDLTIESQNLQVSGQGLQVDHSQNEWRDIDDIMNAVSGLDTAETRLRSASQALTNGLNIVTTRETFTTEFSDVLTEGANKLTLLDQNEEGATLLMLQTRQQLSTTALSLATKSQQAILTLF